MPTTIVAGSANNASMRFNEPYVSDGLNRKTHGVVPAGIIRGGALTSSLSGLSVSVLPDAVKGDSVYAYSNVNGRQITYRETGTRLLNLAANAGSTVYVCLFVDYAISAATLVEWRTYTEAELFGGSPVAEAGYLVIVGKVVVPGVGPIPAANVTADRARFAWKDASRGTVPWEQIVQNGGFEEGIGGVGANVQTIPGYTGYEISGALVSTDVAPAVVPRTGDQALLMELGAVIDVGRIGPGNFDVADVFSSGPISVYSGQQIDAEFWLAGDSVAAYTQGSAGMRLIIEFFDSSGAVISTVQLASDPLVHIGTFAYLRLDGMFAAPDDCYMRWYLEGQVDVGVATSKFFVDDVSILLQPRTAVERPGLTEPTSRSSLIELVPKGATSVQDANLGTLRVVAEMLSGGLTGIHLRRGDALNVVRWLDSIISGAIDIPDSSFGLLGTPRYPQEDTTPADFKLLHRYRAHSSGGTPIDVRMYTSYVDLGYAVSVNAQWTQGVGWSKDDIAAPSIKVSIGAGTLLKIQERVAGAGAWAEGAWSIESGLLLELTDFGPEVAYVTQLPRTRIFTTQATPDYDSGNFGWWYDSSDWKWKPNQIATPLVFALDIPNLAEITVVDAMVNKGLAGAQVSAALIKVTYDFLTPDRAFSTVVSGATAGAVTGKKVITLTPPGTETKEDDNVYHAVVLAGDLTDACYAVRVSYLDRGLSGR